MRRETGWLPYPFAPYVHLCLTTGLKQRSEQKCWDKVGKVLESGAAEVAPPLERGKEGWYLPLFGVYHPKKPEKIRGVFDSSAEFNGTSLNKVLITGPNFTNNLQGS